MPSKTPPPVPSNALSKMEGWYLTVLRAWWTKKKRPPSIGDLKEWLAKGKNPRSRNAIWDALVSLENKGYVSRVNDGSDHDRSFIPKELAS